MKSVYKGDNRRMSSDGEECEDYSLDFLQADRVDDDKPLYSSAIAKYQLLDGSPLQVRLVTAHPLWGHVLYPSSIILSRYIENRAHCVKGVNVLELGAAGGLPSLVAAHMGARLVGESLFIFSRGVQLKFSQ